MIEMYYQQLRNRFITNLSINGLEKILAGQIEEVVSHKYINKKKWGINNNSYEIYHIQAAVVPYSNNSTEASVFVNMVYFLVEDLSKDEEDKIEGSKKELKKRYGYSNLLADKSEKPLWIKRTHEVTLEDALKGDIRIDLE